MKKKKLLTVILFLVPLFLCMGQEEHHNGGSSELIGKAVNFLVLFGGLGFLLYRPVKNYFENRGQNVAESIKDAAELRRDSLKKLEEAQSRMERMSEEVKRITRESETEGKNLKERILAEARQEAEKMKEFTRSEIEMLSQSGIGEIKAFVAELAVRKAEERLKKKIGDREHRSLIDGSIERLSHFYEKSGSH